MTNFTQDQRNVLLQPIARSRVQDLDGISHLAAWDVTAHLNRLFGFEGWDKEILSLDLTYEIVGEREVDVWVNRGGRRQKDGTKKVPACSVGYRCTMRLTIRNPEGEVVRVIDDAAMGTATNQRDIGDAHDLAVKSAVSYALKRCAKDLGDQFGLSLYNKGQQTACVQKVLPYSDGDHEVHNEIHADGIDEGDRGFGYGREGSEHNDGTADPAVEEIIEAASKPESVREPEPAKPAKKPKPEPTPPPEPEPTPEAPANEVEDLVARVAAATSIEPADSAEDGEGVRDIWTELQNTGRLDLMAFDPNSGEQLTLRELMVRKVNEISNAGAA